MSHEPQPIAHSPISLSNRLLQPSSGMTPADPGDYLHRLDELRHEVDELRDRINAAHEEERRRQERRMTPRDTPDRRAAAGLGHNSGMVNAHS